MQKEEIIVVFLRLSSSDLELESIYAERKNIQDR